MCAVEKCSLPNRDKLITPIHVQLSEKVKTFSEFSSAFSKSQVNFEDFQKKDGPLSLFVSEDTACEKRG